MRQPWLVGEELLDDIRESSADDQHFRMWWLGQSGFLVQWQGHHLLFDPYLSDSLTRKYADTDKPHTRMFQRVVDPARLDMVDVITSSHFHTDHLDAETILPIVNANPGVAIVVPAAHHERAAERLQMDVSRLTPIDAGETLTVDGFELSAVPAAHEQVERDEQGRHLYLGYVAQFGRWTV
jgi:L-ascorbate metabolism protein UlaG (beta-lactamase superfamily)